MDGDMKKIVTIIGARPQFVKAAVVSRALRASEKIKEVIVHTGQHFDDKMSKIFFSEMDIPNPDYNLLINSLSHGAMTGRMIEKIEEVLQKECPDFVMVYGDTNSTLAGALAAKKINQKVIHVEAGLRSFNNKMPEEINRILTDRISDLLFCPTSGAVENLAKEGFSNFQAQIHNVGDVMYDAALYYSERSKSQSHILADLKLKGENFVLATIHRAENTDDLDRLKNIIQILNKISDNMQTIFPIHPRTKKIIEAKGFKLNGNVRPIEPVGYFDMLELLKNSKLVITDSGGVQKEAYFFQKYCITLRDQTEWIELVNNNCNWTVGVDVERALAIFNKVKDREFIKVASLYGEGDASKKIVNIISNFS